MTRTTLETCFVISPFGEPYDTYFSHIIKPAIEECDLYAIRGDSLYRPTTIMDDIWSGIRDAKILVAELTDRNPNVFYELGLAHAISKPVILIARAIEDVPFDLRGIRVLLYDKNHPEWGSKLRQGLKQAMDEVLQSPATAIPATFKKTIQSDTPEETEAMVRLEALEATVRSIAGTLESRRSVDVAPSSIQFTHRPYMEFDVGDFVHHGKFGKGRVVEVSEKGSHRRAQINFENAGMKLMDLDIAKLDKI